jgi:hypothetical protein
MIVALKALVACFTLEKWGIVMNVPSSATTSEFVVFLVDDDPGVLRAVSRLFQTAGCKTKAYSSPQSFSLSTIHPYLAAQCSILPCPNLTD